MTRAYLLCGVAALAAALFSNAAAAKTKVYAVVMGNNVPPAGSDLTTLQYADDDAVRFHRYFAHFSDKAFLLTVPDGRTQKRYPKVTSMAMLPNWDNLNRIIQLLRDRIDKDRQRGDETVVYLTFSGHGAYDASGAPYLSLLGGVLTHDKLYDALSQLNADFTHLFIDACYAEGVVGSRGMFDDESDSRHVPLSKRGITEVFGDNREGELPGLGLIMATAAHQKTHEWSQIESGVFTHEILSGLVGPADINLDGKIEYSELSAFIAVANRKVADDRGRITLIARPPARNHHAPLVDLRKFSEVAFLVGDPSSLGHFYIELENGERYLDANLGEMSHTNIVVPLWQRAYLCSEAKEAVLKGGRPGRVIDLTHLHFDERRYASRGSIEASFEKGLFQSAFGLPYYLGYIDSAGLSGVRLDAPRLEVADDVNKEGVSGGNTLAITSFAIAGASAVAAIVLGSLSLKIKGDFSRTELQNASDEAALKYRHLTTAFWITAGVVPVAALAGWLFLPRHRDRSAGHGEPSFSFDTPAGSTFGLTIEF